MVWYCHVCVFIILTVSSCKLVCAEKRTSHIEECPYGYSRYKAKCYKLSREMRYRYAAEKCTLAIIENSGENRFVHKMVQEARESEVWIALKPGTSKNSEGYSNFKTYVRSGPCPTMGGYDGKWDKTYGCRIRRRAVCELKPECEEGWFGAECKKKCHCRRQNCTRETETCSHGCKKGWTGLDCTTENKKPNVDYYCLKYSSHYSLMMILNLNNAKFESLVPLDSDGRSINPKSYTESYSGNRIVELTTEDLTSSFEPYYFERKINDSLGTTFEWSFRLQQYNDVVLRNDLDFNVRCNFSEADVMYSVASMKLEADPLAQHAISSMPPSQHTLKMFLSEPKERQPLSNISIGQTIKMVVTQESLSSDNKSMNKSHFDAVLLSPRSCVARSPDRQIVKQLSDADGCPLNDEIFGQFNVDQNYNVESKVFLAFGLPGYSSIEISCSLVPHYSSDQRRRELLNLCNSHGSSRRRRSVSEVTDEVFHEVAMSVSIS